MPRFGPSSRRQAPVETESLRDICDSVPDATGGILSEECNSVSLEELAGEVKRVQGQSAGKKEDDGTSDESEPLLVPTSAPMVSGRRHHRLRMLIDHLMCRDGKLEESLLERRAARTLAARRSHQTALGTVRKCVKDRSLRLVENVEIDGAWVVYSNSFMLP